MGSSHSVSLSEAAVTLVVVAGAIGLGYKQLAPTPDAYGTTSASTAQSTAKRSKKKKKSASAATPDPSTDSTPDILPPATTVVPFPTVIPGEYIGTTASEKDVPESSKRSKSKKKKGKLASSTLTNSSGPPTLKAESGTVSAVDTTPKTKQDKQQTATSQTSGASQAPRAVKNSIQSSTSIDTDDSWTRVESRRSRLNRSAELTTTSASEADPATTATGSSSPVAERTDDDEYLLNSRNLPEPRRPLAERVLPKPRKTGVESMLETPDYPTVARVVSVRQPPSEEPVAGYSGGEGDGEGDDVGWDVVKSKRTQRTNTSPSSSQVQTSAQKAPETLTKRQRQNANKRDAKKAAKASAEEDRLATLSKHKRELETARMAEQQRPTANKKVSGGMTASVDGHGKLVWE